MSAIDTVRRVIEWAINRETTTRPPRGDVRAVEQLAHPPAELCRALGQLTALTSARLRFGMPPAGDNSSVELENLIIAAAIGVSGIAELARFLFQAVEFSQSPINWVARHGIIAPALSFLPDTVAQDCRIVSPITALLDKPATGQDNEVVEAARKLLNHRVERLSLTLHLAKPVSNPEVRTWRYTLLDHFRVGTYLEKTFVLDVYEAMMIHHEQETLQQVRSAYSVLTDPKASANTEQLNNALSAASWWGPLWAIERADVDALRSRLYLGYTYRQGLKLFRLSSRLKRGGI